MDVRLPDGTVIRGVPDGMSKAELTERLSRNGYDISAMAAQPQEKAADSSAEDAKASLRQEAESRPWLDRQLKGLASAPINLYLGAKQLFGGLDDIEKSVLEQNRAAADAAPFSSFASNVATLVPTMFIPGVNTVTGAGIVGAGSGALQPVDGEQSLENIVKGKALNTVVGGVAGAGGQFAGNKITGALRNRVATKTAEAAAQKSRNSMRDAALTEGREAGYVVPNSEVAPSFAGDRLESLGGKAAIKQEATARNQEVTNALTRKALGIPDDAPISQSALDNIRKTAGRAYQEVADLSPQASADLEALRVARNEAQGWFNAYNRSARPDDLAKAKSAREMVDQLEAALEAHAAQAGRTELIPALADARKQIAKTYTVERALNKATGDVSAPVIGRLYDKGKPLSDGLDTVGKFSQAFPKFTATGVSNPAPGVGKTEMLASALLGTGGAAAAGPVGLAMGALPLLSHPARSLALSKALQKTPEYSVGAVTKASGKLSPEAIQLMARALAAGSVPGALSAE